MRNLRFTDRIEDIASGVLFWIFPSILAGFMIALIILLAIYSSFLDLKGKFTNLLRKSDSIKFLKNKWFLPIYVLALLLIIFIVQLVFYDKIYWSIIGATVLFAFVFYLLSNESIQKIIGEYRRKRTRKVIAYYTYSLIVLFIPLSIYFISQIAEKDFKLEKFSMLVIAPILFAIMNQISPKAKEHSISEKLHLDISRKLIIATIFFFLFVPLIFLIDSIGGIDPNLMLNITNPFINPLPWIVGIFFWSAAFFFYSGLILFMLSLADIFLLLGTLSESKE